MGCFSTVQEAFQSRLNFLTVQAWNEPGLLLAVGNESGQFTQLFCNLIDNFGMDVLESTLRSFSLNPIESNQQYMCLLDAFVCTTSPKPASEIDTVSRVRLGPWLVTASKHV